MMTNKCCAAILAAAMLFAGTAACAQETAPLAPGSVQMQAQGEKADTFTRKRSYNGVEASSTWLYQARLGNRLLNMRLYTAEGRHITFQEDLRSADGVEGDIRLTLRAGVREEKLVLQLDQDAVDTLEKLLITELVVTDTDMNILAQYMTEDLAALRSTFGLGENELLCVSGETEPVTVVSVDGVRRQITD